MKPSGQRAEQQVTSVTIVAISDTHGMHGELTIPDGDILVHAGDITRRGLLGELEAFNRFLETLPHRHKIVIAGNHDCCLEREPQQARALLTNYQYLQDEEATVSGIRFYGSPWQPWFYDWAFNLHRGAEIREKWDLIPEDCEVLVTHSPPYGYGDKTLDGRHAGCEDLLVAVERIGPRLHIFGHIHEGAGVWRTERTTFVNATSCNSWYEPVNAPIVYEYMLDPIG